VAIFCGPVEEKITVFKRILLSRMKFIGDVVLTTPIIRTLRDSFPNAYIAYLGDSKAVSLLENNPYLDEIIPFDFSRKSVLYSIGMFAKLRSKKFDLAIDLFSNPRSALLTFATGAKVRIGGNARWRRKLYTHNVIDDGALKSAIHYHYQSLRFLDIHPKHFETEIFLLNEEKEEAKRMLQALGADLIKKNIVLHPGATWSNKMWLKENFKSLTERVIKETNVNIFVSPGPQDSELISYLKGNLNTRVFPLPLLPVRKLAAVLSLCQVFVSNDCGPMHIGVAVGTKTIGIFGPEPIEIWFPYERNKGHLPLFKKIFCSPCRTTKCFREGSGYMECMQLISVDEVFSAIMERL